MYSFYPLKKVQRKTLVCLWSIGVLMGLAAVKLDVTSEGIGWWFIAGLLLIAALRRTPNAVLLVLISGLLVGNLQGSRVAQDVALYDLFMGQKVTLVGTVSEDPTYGERGERIFYASDVAISGKSLPGKVRISTLSAVTIGRGDAIVAQGRVKPGFGPYQARISYASILEHAESQSLILRVRDSFASGVRNAIPEPSASLGLGFLLGLKSGLPDDLADDLRTLGLTHIIVASGYNLTILIRLARRSLAPISKYQAFVCSLTLMAGFVAVTGVSPSMARAAFVTSLALTAWYYGRRIHPVLLLLFAAAITALINPLYIWSDMGWYLSFFAFAGVLIVAPLIMHLIYGRNEPSFIGQITIETLAAQLMTLPLIMFVFGVFSPLSLLANILIVPLIPLAMLGTFVAGVVGIFLPYVASWFGLLPSAIIWYMISISQILADVSWSHFDLAISASFMVLIYIVGNIWLWLLMRRSNFNLLSARITD
ncbi:hypothetical protein CYG49_04935 [Candidatus Saccharibacteria bacterium]|nr:MAG: hypothetical protein CYG49_04935 [Candidatus Saccharibacteria bacterium]